jgi:hypothetical protein
MSADEYVPEHVVTANSEMTRLDELCIGDTVTTDRDSFAVRVGERWYVEDVTGNGWITLIKQRSTGLNCWDDVDGDTRKVRSKPWPVRRITCAGAFHHSERTGW